MASCGGAVDPCQLAPAWKALYGWSSVGAWYVLDESKTGWSSKPTRPWLVVADVGSGPFVEMMPRTRSARGSRSDIIHASHEHDDGDPDGRTCRIDSAGRIVARDRRPIPRDWTDGPRRFSCYEPDDAVLTAAGCRR